MPEFNRKFTWGIGRFTYTLEFTEGVLSVVCHQIGVIKGPSAFRSLTSDVTSHPGFRYID